MSEKSIKEIVREELFDAKLPKKLYDRFLSGVLRGASELHFTKNGFAAEVKHTDERLVSKVKDLLKEVYGVDIPTESNRLNVGYADTVFYRIVIPQDVSSDLLERAEIVKDKYCFTDSIPASFVKGESARRVFLRGLYLACGSIRVPEEEIMGPDSKKSSGYTLSFSLNSDQVKNDVVKLLIKEAQIPEESVLRKKTGSAIFLRSSEAICNVLTAMGCSDAPLMIYRIMVARKVKNDLNRAQNFDVANIDKTVRAGERQVAAILLLQKTGAFASLSEELRETCLMRLAHPELGIEQLGREFTPPLSKSCVNHRLRKVVELAFGDEKKDAP